MSDSLNVLRKGLMILLGFGLLGLGTELLLLSHTEGIWQKIPLGLIAAGLVALVVCAWVQKSSSVRVMQVVMVLMVLGGLIGLYLHYDGNMEFELEMMPSLNGWKLFKESMTGATPTLAPGSLIQMGLLGLACTYRHPALVRNK